jgi:hypothetical protein
VKLGVVVFVICLSRHSHAWSETKAIIATLVGTGLHSVTLRNSCQFLECTAAVKYLYRPGA